ncbi:MAG TPA: isochorismate synthase [Actinophytocola sp.]|uniref:isochorismate synthase n=1 Tax=Actinophytocola sp. TaxID=1872138 RepID=UPI002DB91493|nr:isochorismate synthase [Actinophytocola sp.]HEU5475410.1 isochorismate synthase [Actinophytocola sp.]
MGAANGEPNRDPIGLVNDYRPGSFFLSTPKRTLLASGAEDTVTEPDPDELSGLVTKLLTDSGIPVAVGALPFDPADSPHVVLPRTARWAGPPRASADRFPVALPGCAVEPLPAPEEFERRVARAVAALNGGELRKVVLARALRLTTAVPVEARAVLGNLLRANVSGYTYAVDLPPAGAERRTLVGASPELLLRRTGPMVTANPIAGTVPRDPDPDADRRAAEALLASAKDLDEHLVVVEAVVDALRPFCRRLAVSPEPELVSTPAVWHLSTQVTGELIDPGISALRLACALHPTPAVCGTPPDLARRTIAELEPFRRGFYAGAVGWCDAAGDGEWVVAIRCAEIVDHTVQLYSGAGIMPASQPHLELAETSAKFRTLLGAMGLELSG